MAIACIPGVPVFAYGPHSLDFRGVYSNTEIFNKIFDKERVKVINFKDAGFVG